MHSGSDDVHQEVDRKWYGWYFSVNYAEVEKCATVDASVNGSAPLLRTWTPVKGIDESASVLVDYVMVSLMSEVSTGVRTGGMRDYRDQGYRCAYRRHA